MLNTSEFAIRLQQVMDYYGLNAAAFADTLEIQRSGISHLLSERNKPSLDFILKLIEKFPEVDMYWITQGKGSFPRKEQKEVVVAKKPLQADLFSDIPEIEMESPTQPLPSPTPPAPVASATPAVQPLQELPKVAETEISKTLVSSATKKIKRIIFFYDDNQFEVFNA